MKGVSSMMEGFGFGAYGWPMDRYREPDTEGNKRREDSRRAYGAAEFHKKKNRQKTAKESRRKNRR